MSLHSVPKLVSNQTNPVGLKPDLRIFDRGDDVFALPGRRMHADLVVEAIQLIVQTVEFGALGVTEAFA